MPYRTDIKGWMYENELQELEKLAQQCPKNGVIVEIGSFCGRSSVCFGLSADPSISIYCYDMFIDNLLDENNIPCHTWDEFIENTKDFKNIIPIKGNCPYETAYIDNRKIDLLFVDAAHKNPNDWDIIEYFLPFMNKNGIISGHDYGISDAIMNENPFPDVNLNVAKLEKMLGKKAKIGKNHRERIWYINLSE